MVQKKWFTKSAAVLMAVVLTGAALLTGCGEKVPEVEISTLETGSANTGGSLHDPFIIQGDDGVFYCYGSHMTAARSDDLSKWKSWANGVTKNNKIFDNLLVEPFDAFAYVGKGEQGEYSVWAPSVIYNKKSGRYIMYFCTTSSYIQSNLCMAESDSPEGPYHYTDTVIYSGLMKPNLTRTNYYDIMGQDKQVRERYITAAGYNNQLWPNAIDPAMFYDRDDRLWMVYGSWSGGGSSCWSLTPRPAVPFIRRRMTAMRSTNITGKGLWAVSIMRSKALIFIMTAIQICIICSGPMETCRPRAVTRSGSSVLKIPTVLIQTHPDTHWACRMIWTTSSSTEQS